MCLAPARRLVVTLRTLRDGTLLAPPPKMPPTSSACFSVCGARCAPAPGRSALLCHASLASRPGRLPSDSGWSSGRPAALRSPSLQSRLPCSAAQRFPLSRFAPFATAHCSPLRRKCRRLCRPVFRSVGLAVYLLLGAQRFPLSRFACSQRAASLCLGLVFGPLCGPPLALAPVHPPCSRRLSASPYRKFRPGRGERGWTWRRR